MSACTSHLCGFLGYVSVRVCVCTLGKVDNTVGDNEVHGGGLYNLIEELDLRTTYMSQWCKQDRKRATQMRAAQGSGLRT
jgi:hypothetical protein